jgi:hypothetical protein
VPASNGAGGKTIAKVRKITVNCLKYIILVEQPLASARVSLTAGAIIISSSQTVPAHALGIHGLTT